AKENLENEKAWDVRFSLIDFAKEIFREEFKAIEESVQEKTTQPEFFRNLLTELRRKKFGFVSFIKNRSLDAVNIISQNKLTDADFKYSGGPFNFFIKTSKITSVKNIDEKFIGKR